MPQLKCEISKEELQDFEQMMKEYGFSSRYGMTKHCVEGKLEEWRKKKDVGGKEVREPSLEPVETDSGSNKGKIQRRIF